MHIKIRKRNVSERFSSKLKWKVKSISVYLKRRIDNFRKKVLSKCRDMNLLRIRATSVNMSKHIYFNFPVEYT